MRPARAQIALSAVALLTAAGLGTTAGLLWGADDTPEPLRSAATIRETPVTARPFTDVRSVDVEFRLGVEHTLSSPLGGRVTAFRCSPTEPFVSGRTNLEVDGLPVVNISTRVPLWRDLHAGDAGDDVASLQEELSRLGHRLAVDGVVGQKTLSAVHDLLGRPASATTRSDAIPATRFLWLPRADTAVTACTTSTGSPIAADGDVASLAAGLVSASIGAVPDGAVPGARVLMLDDRPVPVDPDGVIDDPDALAVIAASAPYAEARRNSLTSMTADFVLAEPATTAAVPPGALYDIQGSTACIVADGTAREVTILGSELGVSFVIPSTGDLPAAVDIAPRAAASCR